MPHGLIPLLASATTRDRDTRTIAVTLSGIITEEITLETAGMMVS
jgi:hypothetical protein